MRDAFADTPRWGDFGVVAMVRVLVGLVIVGGRRVRPLTYVADDPGPSVLRGLETQRGCQDWQARQAEQALRIYFVNFLQRTDWHRRPASTVVDERGRRMLTTPSGFLLTPVS